MIFDDDEPDTCPFYKRLLCSLPTSYVHFTTPNRQVNAPSPYTPRPASYPLFDEDTLLGDDYDGNDDDMFDLGESDMTDEE